MPTVLQDSTWREVQKDRSQVVVLPWGATEAHNLHLPYGTDNYIATALAEAAAVTANSEGAEVMVLPALPYGVNTGQREVRLDMNLNPSTQFMILRDLLTVLNHQGYRKFVVLNTHGGNDFKQHLRELGTQFPDMILTQCNWFKMPGIDQMFWDSGEHAGEAETSLMLYLYPDLVEPLENAGKGEARRFRVEALNSGWAWSERQWHKVTADTGIGNPALASAEKGETLFLYLTEQISKFLLQLSQADPDDIYE